jgi:glutamyl-tRNA reductase
LVNSALQSSKAIKTHTELSGGTVSVSFAAVQYIKEHINEVKDKKIMLLGTGKIGRATCRNLVDYLQTNNITLVNRTEETAQKLADELHISCAPLEQLEATMREAEIILVSTNAPVPVILKEHLEGAGKKLIIDLSIPCNVAADAQTLPNVQFVDVDMLSKIKDETLQKRKAETPKALAIINEHIVEFNEWCEMRRHVPLLKEVKNKLKTIHIDPFLLHTTCIGKAENQLHDEKIQKVINSLAIKMRNNNTIGCHYIEAINDYIG